MSLIFTLLQKDYIVLAADNRHTRGDREGSYINDNGIKVVEILNGRGVLGFAGQDFGEQIVFPAKLKGLLDKEQDLVTTAFELTEYAREIYKPALEQANPPVVQMLMAAFHNWNGKSIATSILLESHFFIPNPAEYPYRRFEVIGKSGHGALYGLHRFGNRDLDIDVALRLSALILFEICEFDISVGGDPQIYVIPREGECKKQGKEMTDGLIEWASGVGLSLDRLVMQPHPSVKC